jgi:Ankyrin repeats (3 copies)
MRLLLDKGLSLSDESCTSAGYTPLLLAAANGHADMLQLMITAGCNVDAKLKNGSTALTLCLQRDLRGAEDDGCCKLLIDAGCSVSTMMSGRSVIHLLLHNGTASKHAVFSHSSVLALIHRSIVASVYNLVSYAVEVEHTTVTVNGSSTSSFAH